MLRKNNISSLDLSILSIFLYRSYFSLGLVNLLINISKNDSIFSIILGSIIGFIPLFMYLFLNNKKESLNIFEKIENTFPKLIHPFFNIILILSIIFISSYLIYNLVLFINYNLLNDLNLIEILLITLVMIIYISSRGAKTIIRVSMIVIFIFIMLSISNLLFLIPMSKVDNIYPILNNSIKDISLSSLYYMIVTTTPILLFLVIPKKDINKSNKINKYMKITYLISNLYNLINLLLIISILGISLPSILKYPDILVLQKINILNLIERIDDILSFKILFESIFIIALSFYYIKEGIIKTFKFKGIKKKYLFDIVIGIIIFILSITLRLTNIYFLIIGFTIFFSIHLLLFLFI